MIGECLVMSAQILFVSDITFESWMLIKFQFIFNSNVINGCKQNSFDSTIIICHCVLSLYNNCAFNEFFSHSERERKFAFLIRFVLWRSDQFSICFICPFICSNLFIVEGQIELMWWEIWSQFKLVFDCSVFDALRIIFYGTQTTNEYLISLTLTN